MDLYVAEAERQERAAAQAVDASNLDDVFQLAQEGLDAKAEYDRLTAEAKGFKERYDEIRSELLPNLMRKKGLVQSNGKGSFTFAGGKVHLETKLYAAVTEANKPTLFSWLRKHKLGDVIKEAVNASTLAALVRERRAEGEADPPGLSIHEETTAKWTKA